jgi:hypothetical protein
LITMSTRSTPQCSEYRGLLPAIKPPQLAHFSQRAAVGPARRQASSFKHDLEGRVDLVPGFGRR